jgi:Uma2 family endonuclease
MLFSPRTTAMPRTLTLEQSKTWQPVPLPQERTWPPPQGEWTYQDYLRLPDDGYHYQVIKGVLLMTAAPKPRHQRISRNLLVALHLFVTEQGMGEVLDSPIDVLFGDLATPVEPDIIFITRERLSTIKESHIEGAPDLIVEILSPSNWVVDRRDKFAVYEAAGVREYWIVDPDARTVEIYSLRRGRYALLERYEPGQTMQSDLLTGFEIPVDDIFE